MTQNEITPTLRGRATRRALLTAAAGAAALLATGASGASAAAPRAGTPGAAAFGRLRALERRHGARLGAVARNTVTGATVLYRADERFPMCSTFKTLAAAAVLRDLDRHGEVLARRIRYTAADIVVNSPRCEENLATGMTVAELCDATIRFSDNTAANLLLRELGGPTAVTRFCRSLGDGTTRLDRWEPELNTCEPWRVEDTTTPAAIAGTYERLVLGDALERGDRERLTGWLLGNTTSTHRFRAGLPEDWRLADKTGGGSYGTNNDVGVAWTPEGAPVVLAVLTTKPVQDAPSDDLLVARAASVLASAVT
ncbi:class A beta-lactamase [Streptomyces sp. WAC05374]|uniref:class A beta-lactamase n=1 Tax=Streptomyces sp. WAC05374 TaxID=2487420 RepID=UPI000F894463|nr:class A beta-lactamase [Streptomyces sp. WAC05374]RST18752.1 class A beta-lactamase [Streptomyces sp. WAC05374]TDF40266.1 class A beta-lactamase [Streptomyces sp. WAC05374]TDF53456.1 class A beta-lactamase [Streptomyces sp. WAC05374]TDF59303.1 class A beta-lactamase [Streptomyces sp. WAC05374]